MLKIFLFLFFRAKLADWQASKGKTLKRPAIKIAKTKVFETKQVKSHFEPDTQHNTKDFLKAQEVLPTGHFLKANNQSPVEAQHMGDVSTNTLIFCSGDLLSITKLCMFLT